MSLKIISILAVVIILFSGCTQAPIKQTTVDFNSFLANNPKPDEIIQFINTNLADLSDSAVSKLVLALETAQNEMLPNLEQEIFPENIQIAFSQGKTDGLDEILTRTTNNFFKIETSEGMYYPVIDYSKYKTWSDNVTEDISSFINIMAIESDTPPAKDAAIIIAWDEIIDRAFQQEKFIQNYPQSERISQVKQTFTTYKQFILYGANNTPLFDYETKKMNNEALTAYQKAITTYKDTALVQMITDYLNVINANNYIFTKQVNDFRDKYGING